MCPQPAKPIRYAIYTRQSVDKGDALSSCETQFLTCQDFAKAADEPGLQWIGHRFDDEGFSGATLDRPAMRKLRKVMDLGGIDRLYAVALDRLTRSMRDAIVLLDELEKHGVELRLVHQAELASDPQNRLLRYIFAAFAEFERETIVERLADTRGYLRKHCRRLAGPPPFGYDADPITKQLVPNRAEARRARLIFARAARGQTPAEIAGRINHLKWRTKERVSRRSDKLIGGGKWNARQVTRLLRDPVYLGKFVDGDGYRDGSHPPIIGADLYQAVQEKLDGRRTTMSTSRGSYGFPLRCKVLCPKCRRPLATYVITKRRGPSSNVVFRYYRCRSTAGGRAPCKGVSYPAWEIEQFVRERLEEESTWLAMLEHEPSSSSPANAKSYAAAWCLLDDVSQIRLLPDIVESLQFRRKNTELRITFTQRLRDIVSDGKIIT